MRRLRRFFEKKDNWADESWESFYDMIADLKVEVGELRRRVEKLEEEEIGTSNSLYELENLIEALHPEIVKFEDPWD
jgi:predicted  nucleic acid-binding Zn-ribbon protein